MLLSLPHVLGCALASHVVPPGLPLHPPHLPTSALADGAARWPAIACPRSSRSLRTPGVQMQQFDEKMFAHYANPPKYDGTSLNIVEFPNPILRARNAEITEFDDKLAQLAQEFFTVMYGASGVGLAAPQVGLNIQLFVYNPDPTAPGALKKMGERVVANPKIIEYCQATDVEIEGCLSSRAECCRGDIRRCKELQVEYQDERGRVKRKKLRGFEARVFQHEYDHLQGVLHIDRQTPTDRKKIQPYLDVLVEQFGDGGALELDQEVVATLKPPVTASNRQAKVAMQPAKSAAAAATGSGGGGMGGGSAAKKTGFGGGAAKAKKGGKKKKRK